MSFRFFAASFLTFSSSIASATPLKLVAADLPPNIIQGSGATLEAVGGICGEVLNAAFKSDPELAKMEVKWLPWKRAMETAQTEENTIVCSLTRTKAREENYQWISEIIVQEAHVYTLNPKKVNNVEELKKLKSVSVLGGSPFEAETKKIAGMEGKIESSATEPMSVKKLAAGRVDAWVTQNFAANFEWKRAGEDLGKLSEGYKLLDIPTWVATSKKTPAATVERMRQLIEKFKSTPEFSAVISKFKPQK